MKKDAAKLLVRAEECLVEARQLFEFDHYLGAINRAYYCIFGCARALLHEKGLYAKTHQGVQTKINELFIKTALMERKQGDSMRNVFELRQISDYDLDADLTEEDALFAIDAAVQFMAAAKNLLGD